ncbi:MAG: cytidine 5'-phosphate N-acetylneuraminic acid synthetase [Burkholderiales bacterium]|nr:cytidine 5'-phosphate N-acetylneuraminic acid synthetase [Burkholderiales bacterium]
MEALLIVIPAIKKSVAFPDDLVKKLAGVTLIQRAIAIATDAVPKLQVLVVTDSAEIDLICRRQDVATHLDPALQLPRRAISALDVAPYLEGHKEQWEDLLLLSPYVPLLSAATLRSAYEYYCSANARFLVPVIRLHANPFTPWPDTLRDRAQAAGQVSTVESAAFSITSRTLLEAKEEAKVQALAFPLEDELIEICDYQDWWLCEKLLNRRRIVFRVIGHKAVGMGHLYRCLALAHEISDHEVYFVCDTESVAAANKLAGYDYWLGAYDPGAIEQAILDLKPDLVVNDILNTDANYVHRLRAAGVRVVNFEDLGSGAAEADLTINDLYDEPQLSGARILWGQGWFILRDEFSDALPQPFQDRVARLLITFGGTDPSDFTRRVLPLIAPYCADQEIGIDVVTGDGYGHVEALETLIAGLPAEITYTHATGVISQIMETAQLAICSNGRTVYELAQMHIPALVLSHHARELSHRFACEQNGFSPVDIPNGPEHDPKILQVLHRLVEDVAYRRKLFDSMQHHSFSGNKRKVVERLQSLLKEAR